MMKIWIFILLSLPLFADVRTVDIPYLEAFDYRGEGHIEIVQGDHNQFTIEGTKTQVTNADIEAAGGTLKVSPTDPFSVGTVKDLIKGKLIVKDLKKIYLSGSVSVDIDSLKGESLMIDIGLPGANLLEGTIDVRRLGVHIEGGTRVVLKGRAKEEMVFIKGSGAFEGENLQSEQGHVRIEGAGSAFVNVADTLKATIVGYGNIHYVGTPKQIDDNIKGEGKISPYQPGQQPQKYNHEQSGN